MKLYRTPIVYNQEQQTTALTIRGECLEWLMTHRIHDTDIHAFYQAAGALYNLIKNTIDRYS